MARSPRTPQARLDFVSTAGKTLYDEVAIDSSPTSLINHDSTFMPLQPDSCAPFLQARGFSAEDYRSWRLADLSEWPQHMPRLEVEVSSHEEAGPHTWYGVACTLDAGSQRRVEWTAPRRLTHLREFHDHFKAELGPDLYGKVFVDACGQRVHFAHRGGLVGTTKRLDAWFRAIAVAVNSGQAMPCMLALVLHFLRAPSLSQPESTTAPIHIEELLPRRGDGTPILTKEPCSPLRFGLGP